MSFSLIQHCHSTERTGAETRPVRHMCDLQWAEDSLDNFFDISRRGSTIGTELRAGLTSFLTLRSVRVRASLFERLHGVGCADELLTRPCLPAATCCW